MKSVPLKHRYIIEKIIVNLIIMKIALSIFLLITQFKSLTTCNSEGPGYLKMASKVKLVLHPNIQ